MQITAYQKRATFAGGSILIILFAAIFMSMKNTVQLTVFARRELVRNMQYVGASHWRIRGPFLLEGIVQGGLGALFAWVALMLLKSTLFQQSEILWGDPYLLPVLLYMGGSLGLVSGYVSVHRFIR